MRSLIHASYSANSCSNDSAGPVGFSLFILSISSNNNKIVSTGRNKKATTAAVETKETIQTEMEEAVDKIITIEQMIL